MLENIRMIPIGWLEHHPENPRQDMGDLSELAESIKRQGIMQNLTIVPAEEERTGDYYMYWVVIGNRRLEASRMAGLTELPCVISDMDRAEQVATMLAENMHRADLTIYEQAKGIQMMMDLGFTKDQVVERTGFSRATVDRRLAVASLPEKPAKQAVAMGYDLLDLVEISKIDDRNVQKELLDNEKWQDPKEFNPARLRQRIETAKRDVERKKERKRLLPEVEKFAAKMTEAQVSQRYGNGWVHVNGYDIELKPDAAVKVPKEEGKYYYYESWGTIEIWKKAKKEKHVKTDAEIAWEKKQHDAKELNARMKENRIAFCASWKPTRVQETTLKAKLWEYVFDNVSSYENGAFKIYYHTWDTTRFRQYCGMPKEEGRDKDETILAEIARRGIPLGRAILAWILCGGVRTDDRIGYASEYRGEYTKDEDMDQVYDILTDNGYQLSDEEQQWKDGTHPFYGGGKDEREPDERDGDGGAGDEE